MSESLIRMPKLADTLVEGTLGQWLKQVGEEVRAGEPLATIETDKVTTELTSAAAGTLLEVLVAEGQTVPVETPIARIGSATAAEPPEPAPARSLVGDGDAGDAGAARSAAAAPDAGERAAAGPAVADAGPPAAPAPPPRVTPVAARLLAEHGLEPGAVGATAGRITKADVLAHLTAARAAQSPSAGDTRSPAIGRAAQSPSAADTAPPAAPRAAQSPSAADAAKLAAPPRLLAGERGGSTGPVRPLSAMRRAIAEHMRAAAETIPHGHTAMAADLTDLVAWRDAHKSAFQQREGANLTFTVLFVHALARQLASLTGASADVGVAVALEAGLIVPVVRQADTRDLGATARAIADLAGRARTNRLTPADTQGAAMTVTNVGSFGNLTATPIIPLGQLGILAPGVVERRPLPTADGGVRPGWRCLVALMFDRRRLDDFAADRFLRAVLEQLVAVPTPA